MGPPTLYPIGSGELARIEIGPKLVTFIGGAPGQGKTALTMQWLIDALTLRPTLRASICNVEMNPSILLDRQLGGGKVTATKSGESGEQRELK